jgi:hypothetical protein
VLLGVELRSVLVATDGSPIAHDVHVTTALRQGSIADEIVQYAEARTIDLIVVASHGHGHGRVTGMLLGSASRGVLHKATHPVLIARSTSSMRSTSATVRATTSTRAVESAASRGRSARR